MKNYMRFLPLLLLLSAVPVHANDLTLFAGAQRQGKLTVRQTTGAITSLTTRSFGTFGLRFSQGRVIGGEHTLSYSPNFISTQSHGFFYHSNFKVEAPLPVVRPYATVGLGTVYIGGNVVEAMHGAKFALNYGGGIKLKPAGPIGLQVGARGYQIYGLQDQTMSVLEVSVGVVFFFGPE